MKIIEIIRKSFIEQKRSFWLLMLTWLMAPFFVFVFYLINESTMEEFDLVIFNPEVNIEDNTSRKLIQYLSDFELDTIANPFNIQVIENIESGIKLIEQKKADILIILPENLGEKIEILKNTGNGSPYIEFKGDLTEYSYLLSAIYVNEILNSFFLLETGSQPLFTVKETPIGNSLIKSEFDYYIPGLLILSIIMLIFTASIAFISDIENKTIIRLQMAGIKTRELITGIAITQICIGVIAVFITLGAAGILGFQVHGKFGFLLFIAILATISIIAFSLIVSAFTKSASEILVVGNFPMFLFMFFTGAVFPISSKTLFSFMNYEFQLHALMSPAHAISALKKVLVLDLPVKTVLPEILSILMLTLLYFLVGYFLFNKRHLKSNTT
jgi:ABC-type multidrug transport system permease subunit